MSWRFIAAALLGLMLAPAHASGQPAPEARKKLVCTVSINSDLEALRFRKTLPQDRFEFRELVPQQGKNPLWFEQACHNLRAERKSCDILIVSGHFGGTFFGASGHLLPLESLEEMSCNASCPEIMHAPKEVFLLGCNTLAGKSADRRSPDEYREVLRQELDGNGERVFTERQVEEIVASRYSTFGESNYDRMRQAFLGVPHVYGFHSVSPSAVNTVPPLSVYLNSVPDYAAHLDRLASLQTDRPWLQSPVPANRNIANAFKVTSFSQTSGIGVAENAEFCALFDDAQPMSDRLLALERLLGTAQGGQYLPLARQFLRRYPPQNYQGEELAETIFERMRSNRVLQAQFQHSLDQLRGLPILSLDLVDLGESLGYMPVEEARKRRSGVLVSLLDQATTASKDLVCSRPSWPVIAADAIGEHVFRSPAGVYALGCLSDAPRGLAQRPYIDHVTAMLDHKDPAIRKIGTWLVGMARLDSDAIQTRLVRGMANTSVDLRLLSAWALRRSGGHSAQFVSQSLDTLHRQEPAVRRDIALMLVKEMKRPDIDPAVLAGIEAQLEPLLRTETDDITRRIVSSTISQPPRVKKKVGFFDAPVVEPEPRREPTPARLLGTECPADRQVRSGDLVRCRTGNGIFFQPYYSAHHDGWGWRDESTNIVWYAADRKGLDHYAMEMFCDSLPGAESPSLEALQDVYHKGASALLGNFRDSWIWSSAVDLSKPLYAAGFNAANGQQQQARRSFSSEGTAGFCIQRITAPRPQRALVSAATDD